MKKALILLLLSVLCTGILCCAAAEEEAADSTAPVLVLYFMFSLAIGYAAGRGVAEIGLNVLSNSTRHLEYISSPFQSVWTAVSVFVFLVIGHLITMRSMKNWDLVENTKGRE